MPTDTHVVIRFSDAMEPSTLTSDSLTLRGPSSVVITHIVAAEHGRLAFIWPAQRLAEGTTYALTVAGARNAVGLAVIPASIAFTTAERRSDDRLAGRPGAMYSRCVRGRPQP